MKKRIVCCLLALALLCTLLPAVTPAVHAEPVTGSWGDNLTWSYDPDTKTLTITGSGPMNDFYDSSDCPWWEYHAEIEKVSLPEGLTSIGRCAFYEHTALKEITVPGSVEIIFDYAFSGCTSLRYATLQEGVTEIDFWAFDGCPNLAGIRMPASLELIVPNSVGFVFGEGENPFIKVEGLTIYGIPGTNAESYATYNGFTFCAVDPVSGFGDVAADAFYYESMLWAVENGITAGTSPFTFSPKDVCTRAQVVTFLWRANGCPEPTTTECPFTDVSPSAYYYKAVLWAVENYITRGATATTFNPRGACTRGQVVTFLSRSFGVQMVGDVELPFTDVPEDSYCHFSLLWAYKYGIATGLTPTTFGPNKPCNRGQVVTFIYRAYHIWD